MKILHLNYYENQGGAAIAAQRIHNSLLNKEVDKMMKEVGFADTGRVGALKQKKLYIKDQIMKLQKEVDLLGDPVYTK